MLAFGTYRDVSLVDARERLRARAPVGTKGIDPGIERKNKNARCAISLRWWHWLVTIAHARSARRPSP